MKDIYLNSRLPWPAKIAAGMLTPGKWRPFEIYLTTTWTAPYFDHTYLGLPSTQHQIEWFLDKNKRSYIIFCDYNHSRASAHRSCLKVQD
jgi:hypothetical protein